MAQQGGNKYESIYPQVQALSGMAARSATSFKIPIATLFTLLFIPLFVVIALCTVYFHATIPDRTNYAGMTIVIICGAALLTILIAVLLANARAIVRRNCRHAGVVFAVYLLVATPIAALFVYYSGIFFKGIILIQLLGYEVALIAVMVMAIVLLARRLSR